ncbi:MAG: hypothetical protein EHM42_08060, partial [Planctomycetaceae bacterium]
MCWFLVILLGFITVVGPASLASAQEGPERDGQTAEARLVIKSSTPYYRAGAKKGEAPLGTLPEGTSVIEIQRIEGFVYVDAGKGRKGWIADSAVAKPGSKSPAAADVQASEGDSARSSSEFACALYKAVSVKSQGNVLFSPASIEAVLGVMLAGAQGATRTEIAQVLRRNLDAAESERDAAAENRWQRLNQSGEGFQVVCANHLWGAPDVQFKTAFAERVLKSHGAEMEQLDFMNGARVKETINGWVRDKTKGEIPSIIDAALDPATRLVVTNAVYFKATWGWEGGFPRKYTESRPFYSSGQKP